MTRTLATFAQPGSFVAPAGQAGEILVGRKVANTSFLRALLQYGSFDQYCFLVGENADIEAIEGLLEGIDPAVVERIVVRNVLELPDALAGGDISVLHQNSHADQMGPLISLRDRHATRAVPITGQIHSLSYPAMMGNYLDTALAHPTSIDAVFCSSQPGKEVVERCFTDVLAGLAAKGLELPAPEWEMPVIPLGISCDALAGGDRTAMRRTIGIPEDAFVVLSMARFTEFDKMDIFPVLTAFASFKEVVGDGGRKPWLLLAGARQGTRTPEMVELWAGGLGLADQLSLRVDFPEQEKADLLACADLFIAPSDNPQETFGITVIEAMAAGLPIIAADFNGYKDTVPAEVGIRVATHWNGNMERISELGPMLYQRPLHLFLGQSIEVDLGEFADALERLYRDEVLRRQMGEAGAARAREVYDWTRVIPQYEAVWDELASRPFSQRKDARHPLLMDFQRVFGHYTTTVRNTSRQVQRSALADLVCQQENAYPIYPELTNIFDGNAVMSALQLAQEPIEISSLEQQVAEAMYAHSPWRASLLVAWMVKHGLVESAP